MKEKVMICEVGPRDGLQMAHEIMPTALKARWIAAIAQAGYERTMRDHTYALRFRDIFRQIGFGEVGDTKSRRGVTQEVT